MAPGASRPSVGFAGQLVERKHSPMAATAAAHAAGADGSGSSVSSSAVTNRGSPRVSHASTYSHHHYDQFAAELSKTGKGGDSGAAGGSAAAAAAAAGSHGYGRRSPSAATAVTSIIHRIRTALSTRFSRLSRDQVDAVTIVTAGLVALAVWALLWLREEVSLLQQPQGMCAALPAFPPSEAEVTGRAGEYGRLDVTQPMVIKYLRLIHGYLQPWQRIPGIQSGLGHRGFVTPEALHRMSRQPAVMSCSGHVKVIGGRVFFRYGGFWHVYYRLNRFLQTVKMIQDAIDLYGLTDLRLEMIVNTCDHPQAFHSSHWSDRAGYPIMSMGFTSDTIDIPIPDPLDLTEDYTPDLSTQVPWDRKEPRAVFRGKTTNFDMLDGNWGANPRVRLHRLSDAHKGLMEAHINAWSHATPAVVAAMAADGLLLAKRMNFTQFNAFKYQVIVDGGGGSCRTCGVLRSNQLSIRQKTPLFQFYEPLLEDGVHWLVTTRTFSDLPSKIRWAQENDDAAQRLVQAANRFASYACTWSGRRLYWALLLIKYADVMADPDAVTEPTANQICRGKPILEASKKGPSPASVHCEDPEVAKKQPSCGFFCAKAPIPESGLIWLPSEVLRSVKKIGPP